jgi:hypothetical protein
MKNVINVLGTIWMPSITAGQAIEIVDYDKKNIGEVTRENVEQWLCSCTSDFKSIIDFGGSIDGVSIDWKDAESENTFNDCMYGDCQAGD